MEPFVYYTETGDRLLTFTEEYDQYLLDLRLVWIKMLSSAKFVK